MPEDKLTRAQRIRLEALSQAVSITPIIYAIRPMLNDILNTAEEIEQFLLKASGTIKHNA